MWLCSHKLLLNSAPLGDSDSVMVILPRSSQSMDVGASRQIPARTLCRWQKRTQSLGALLGSDHFQCRCSQPIFSAVLQTPLGISP